MSILTQGFSKLIQKTLQACLPNSCFLCGGDGVEVLCPACTRELPLLPVPRCPQCAEPTPNGEHCGHCLKEAPHFDRTIALFRYGFPVDRLIHALKYGSQLSLASWFGQGLRDALAGQHFDLVMPLPLHPTRLRERGFNQAAEMAKIICQPPLQALDLTSCRRSRATSPQAELSLKDRSANVRGAFECVADLSGQHILLVDDVMTSGATLSACARVLKLHGAASVTALVAARALRT